MNRTTHPAAAIPAEADKPRVVIDYTGIQVLDARTRLRVVLSGEIPRGVKTGLRIEGFKPTADENVWEAPNTPLAIFGAQAVVDVYYRKNNEEEFNG